MLLQNPKVKIVIKKTVSKRLNSLTLSEDSKNLSELLAKCDIFTLKRNFFRQSENQSNLSDLFLSTVICLCLAYYITYTVAVLIQAK